MNPYDRITEILIEKRLEEGILTRYFKRKKFMPKDPNTHMYDVDKSLRTSHPYYPGSPQMPPTPSIEKKRNSKLDSAVGQAGGRRMARIQLRNKLKHGSSSIPIISPVVRTTKALIRKFKGSGREPESGLGTKHEPLKISGSHGKRSGAFSDDPRERPIPRFVPASQARTKWKPTVGIDEMLIDMLIDFRLNEWLAPDQYKSRLQKNFKDAQGMEASNMRNINKQHARGRVSDEDVGSYGNRTASKAIVNPSLDPNLASKNIDQLTALRQQRANRVEAGRKPNFLQRLFKAPEPPTPKNVIMRRNQQLPLEKQKPTPQSISSGVRVGHPGGDWGVKKFRNRIELLRKLRRQQ